LDIDTEARVGPFGPAITISSKYRGKKRGFQGQDNAAQCAGPYRKTQSRARLAAQATNNAIVSVVWIRAQAVWLMMLMGGQASGDSRRRVPGEIFDIFFALHESFTTQEQVPPPSTSATQSDFLR